MIDGGTHANIFSIVQLSWDEGQQAVERPRMTAQTFLSVVNIQTVGMVQMVSLRFRQAYSMNRQDSCIQQTSRVFHTPGLVPVWPSIKKVEGTVEHIRQDFDTSADLPHPSP